MKRESVFRRLLSMMLVIAMICTLAVPAFAADETEQTVSIQVTQVDNDSVTAKLPGRTPAGQAPENAGYSDKDVVRVSIIMEKAGAIDAGYSPEGIATNKAAASYQIGLEEEQDLLIGKIEATTGTELDVVWNLTLAANLISANVPYGQIEAIEAVPGVRAVVIETQYAPDVASAGGVDPNMATSGEQIGSNPAWAAGYTGAGTRIAIIDTGLDVQHEAFNAGAYTYSLGKIAEQKGMTADAYIDSLNLMDEAEIQTVLAQLNVMERMNATAADLYVNEKVPFGFNYVDSNLNLAHYNSEHGSHVAGISAANAYVADGEGYADALDTTFVKGVAPDAQLLVMKVFGTKGGAYDADYMAAIEDAILLGADTVNLSLGSGNPGMSRCATDEYQKILEALVKCGVVVTISAGNSGSWVENTENGLGYLYLDDVSMHTGGSPGTYTNSLGVASVENSGFTSVYLEVDGTKLFYAESLDYSNKPMTTLAGEQEYVFIDGIGTPEQFESVKDILAGKIAMCYRGETSFFEKANAAMAAGAKGVIIVNNQSGIIYLNLTGYTYTAPVVSVGQADGEYFKAAGTEAKAGELTYWTGKLTISDKIGVGSYNQPYYTMSSFSSWGVPGSLEMKPEITAPGGNIYSVAGYVPGVISGHNKYEMMSGTSMAAPQVAGMAALVMQYIREEGLVEKTGVDIRTLTQSLLMSTAEPILDGNNYGYYYPVLQQGAGLANVGNATSADSFILMGEDATDSYADGKVKAELGDDPEKKGVYSFTFTVNNMSAVEKTFAFSADIFTQGAFAYSGILLMDDMATTLDPNVTWTVNGKAVENGAMLAGMDFNGDGIVNSEDGQTLLDFATGKVTELTNEKLADLNADGTVNSYDSYLFYSLLNDNGATIGAGESATVKVTIDLSADDEAWLANYENGAYIQGYVYAESLATSEGVAGTVHSIPVLGFYGCWSDPSMYDRGSMMGYQYGLEQLPPYLYESVLGQGYANGLLITYGNDKTEYIFGGNPFVTDKTYMPERDAISSVNGDKISMLGFTTIRNAAAANLQVWNEQTGEYYINEDISDGPLPSAYFYVNGQVWDNTYWQVNTAFNGKDIPENTRIRFGVTAALEYYMDDEGNIAWDELGKGATFSMGMTVDNTAPTLDDVAISLVNDTLNIQVTDNQYVAGVALFDIFGQYIYTFEGSKAQNAGDTLNYALDLSGVNGASFLLQVSDYANNITTYKIETQIGEVVDKIEEIQISDSYAVLQKGNEKQLTAMVLPVNAADRGVVWTSSNEAVATVDENGVVTAIAEGNAVITATAHADATVAATCRLTVIDIAMDLNAVVWDEEGSIWFSEFNTAKLPEYTKLSGDMLGTDYFASATVAADGMIYACSIDTNSDFGGGYMYRIDPQTWEATQLAACEIQGLHIFFSDLTYAPAMYGTGALIGAWQHYLFTIDPVSGQIMEIIDEYESMIVGVATCYGEYYAEYEESYDTVYVILNDGMVYQEMYVTSPSLPYTIPYFFYMYGGHMGFDSGISVGDAWFYNSAYYDYDNGYLFWAAHEPDVDDDVTLYVIDEMSDFSVYTLGKFGKTVWPVAGLHELGEIPPYEVMSVPSEEAEEFRARFAENGVAEIQQITIEDPAVLNVAEGGLNAAYENGKVEVGTDVKEEIDTVTVKITAKDENGADVASNNGVNTVTYDTSKLKLENVTVAGQHVSVNDQNGVVTFGYVDLNGLEAGETVATLTFSRVKDTCGDADVEIAYEEMNDKLPEQEETLTVECLHEDTELTGKKDATCTEDGYTGDLVCKCGEVITKGEAVKAAGHKWTTTFANGLYTHTCQTCKTSYVTTNPSTGDSFDPMLVVMIMSLSVAAVVTVVIVGKKRRMF